MNFYSDTIEKALRISAKSHAGQFRKTEKELPYFTHPVAVAFILFSYVEDHAIVAAAILHDTIEDTEYTFSDLQKDFNNKIKKIVEGVTEDKYRNGKKIPWKQRKNEYIVNLRKAPKESVFVAVADKYHNLNSMVAAYQKDGEKIWKNFRNKEESMWFYSEVLDVAKHRIETQLVDDYENLINYASKVFKI